MKIIKLVAIFFLSLLVQANAQLIAPSSNPPYKLEAKFGVIPGIAGIKPLLQVQYVYKGNSWVESFKINYLWLDNTLKMESSWLSQTGYKPSTEYNYIFDSNGNVNEYFSFMYNNDIKLKRENSLLSFIQNKVSTKNSTYFNMITFDTTDSQEIQEKYSYNEFGKLDQITTYFNDSAYQIAQYTYDVNKALISADTLSWKEGEFTKVRGTTYTYDESGRLMKQSSVIYKDGNASSIRQTEYIYNADSTLKSRIFSYGTSSSNFQLLVIGKQAFQYDNLGRIKEVKEFEFPVDDKNWVSRTSYSYTDNSIEEIEFQQNLFTYEEKPVSKWVTTLQGGTSVAGEVSIPQSVSLEPYPNPLQENSTVAFAISTDASLKITLHDILGNEIGELYNGFKTSGSYSIPFEKGNLTSGTYFLKMNVNGQIITKSIIITQ